MLRSYGSLCSKADLTIAGHPIADPSLPDIVRQLPAEPKAEITASFALGTQFHLGQVSIKGAVGRPPPRQARPRRGRPAVAADVLARDRLLNADLRTTAIPWPGSTCRR